MSRVNSSGFVPDATADRSEPDATPTETVVDIVVPVHNEEHVLEQSIRRLHAYLDTEFPFTWQITVVDNASVDGTLLCASRLARELTGVRVRHLDRKGRGLALRTGWGASTARVVAYMDVDLSTDLAALLPLIAPLVSGHSDVAVGSRLSPESRVARFPRRELLSRGYNFILRVVFATRVRDAQCGFKAMRTDVARALLPVVEDDGWFFDTELLLLAEHNGLRIHQVPVDWVDDADSRVRVASTVWHDLAGTARMAWRFARGRGRVHLPAVRREPADDLGRWVVSFTVVGFVSTAVTLAVFLLTRGMLGAVLANALAISVTFLGNAWAHARFTARRRSPAWPTATAIYLGSLALASGALVIVDAAGGGLDAELSAVAATSAVATLGRLQTLRRPSRRGTR